MSRSEFGAKVKRERLSRGWSARQAARYAGLADLTWRDIERDVGSRTRKRETILAIARALGWDTSETLVEMGEAPATDGETSAVLDPHEELEKVWPRLSLPRQWALVCCARSMDDPHTSWLHGVAPERGAANDPGGSVMLGLSVAPEVVWRDDEDASQAGSAPPDRSASTTRDNMPDASSESTGSPGEK